MSSGTTTLLLHDALTIVLTTPAHLRRSPKWLSSFKVVYEETHRVAKKFQRMEGFRVSLVEPEDIAQSVMMRFNTTVSTKGFETDASSRGYIRTAIRNAYASIHRSHKNKLTTIHPKSDEILVALPAESSSESSDHERLQRALTAWHKALDAYRTHIEGLRADRVARDRLCMEWHTSLLADDLDPAEWYTELEKDTGKSRAALQDMVRKFRVDFQRFLDAEEAILIGEEALWVVRQIMEHFRRSTLPGGKKS